MRLMRCKPGSAVFRRRRRDDVADAPQLPCRPPVGRGFFARTPPDHARSAGAPGSCLHARRDEAGATRTQRAACRAGLGARIDRPLGASLASGTETRSGGHAKRMSRPFIRRDACADAGATAAWREFFLGLRAAVLWVSCPAGQPLRRDQCGRSRPSVPGALRSHRRGGVARFVLLGIEALRRVHPTTTNRQRPAATG